MTGTRIVYTPGIAELYREEDLLYFIAKANEIMHEYPSVELVVFTNEPYPEGLGETGLEFTIREERMPHTVWVKKDRYVEGDVLTILLPEEY
jgi:hypothetical protein